MTNELREQITQWLTDGDTFFLLGAGCSVCAGKPMIGELTKNVLKDGDPSLCDQFKNLKETGNRPATVEDLINHLVRYRGILNTIKNAGDHDISIEEIDKWLVDIKKKIVSEVADDWMPSDYHKRFLLRVVGQSQRSPRDLFCLNYDTILEASLDELRIPYADGFRGTIRAWFDPDTFDDVGARVSYRLFKLHGSINWTRDRDEYVRRGHYANETTDEPIVVYPSEQKYLETRYGVYETLLGRFRTRLRASRVNNCLIVLGYSFNDEHINEAICDAVTARGSNLTVVAFIGPEESLKYQKERLDSISKRCDSRFNGFIGSGSAGHFVGQLLDPDAARVVLESELWRFENLVNFIAMEES